MARIESWFNQDLNEAVKVRYLDGNVFSQDNQGNLVGVNVFENGEPASLGGSVSANVVRSDGTTVAVSGTLSGNQASVILPQSAYAVPGVVSIIIKLTDSGVITTLCAVVANVYKSTTDTVVDPGTIIPSVQDLIDDIETAIASIPADYSDLLAAVASEYSNSKTYPVVGSYAWYDGVLKRSIVPITTAESYTAAHWTNAVIGDDLCDLKSALTHQGTYNAYDVLYPFVQGRNGTSVTSEKATFVFANDICTVTSDGATTGRGIARLFWVDRYSMPDGFEPGKTYHVKINTSNSNLKFRIVQYDDGNILSTNDNTADYDLTINPNTEGMQIAFIAESGKTFASDTISAQVIDDWNNFTAHGILANNTDLDTVKSHGYYMLNSSNTYTHIPDLDGSGGILIVFPATNNTVLQVVVKATTISAGQWFFRSSVLGAFTSPWTEIKGGNTYNNTYNSEHYENTYSITCSPEITTDTNNYLASTGDTTDRTGDIQTMLNTTGVCHLGPGVFYTTGIEVPNYGILDGCGNKTELRLADSVTTGYAVKLKTGSSVRNMMIKGAGSAITPSSTVGARHGILFEGTSDAQSSPVVYYRASVSNCLIIDFTGGGITMNNTGKSPSENMLISDCFIVRCGAGINIAYISEFHRITNVTAQGCYYGCIDNGGNNNFANCDFSTNKIGLLIDNSTGQSPNNSHGTFSACTFNHTDNTYSGSSIISVGTAIKILGASAGEIFTGCQIFFGGIEIEDSVGIRFIGANIGRMVPISVTDSTVVVFDDCTMYDGSSSPLTQSGNTRLEFNKCYLRDGTAFDPME